MENKPTNKVAALDTEYAKKQYAEFQKQHRRLIYRRRRLAILAVVALIFFCFVGFQLFSEHQRLDKLMTIKAETNTNLKKTDNKVASLKRDVALLNDKEYVLKEARSRFYYSKDGELIFALPEQKQKQENQEDPVKKIIKSETTSKSK